MAGNDFREHIYNLVCGNYTLQMDHLMEYAVVKDEFAESSDCANAYARMLNAYSRLCERLGTQEWEDPDVEAIIHELSFIGHYIALKMYDYGYLLGKAPHDFSI